MSSPAAPAAFSRGGWLWYGYCGNLVAGAVVPAVPVFAGYDLDRVLTHDELVKGDNAFFSATGVTDGDVLQGVRYQGARSATTESLVMRSRSGTVRRIHARIPGAVDFRYYPDGWHWLFSDLQAERVWKDVADFVAYERRLEARQARHG